MNQYYIYMMASKKNGTIYTGVTNNLTKRIYEHKNKVTDGFTNKYDIGKLVYYEICNNAYEAIAREKAIKKWKREWKIELIEKFNPTWDDLYHLI